MTRLVLRDFYHVFKKLIFVLGKNVLIEIYDLDGLFNVEVFVLEIR